MNKIVQVGADVLRHVAQEVPVDQITNARIQSILKDMQDALDGEPDGAALAAPQIGIPLRIFILASRVFRNKNSEGANKGTHLVFINPVILKRSKKKVILDEGCLSVRGKYGNVKRSANVTIEAYDENGNKFTRGAGGLMAQAFQHECDHLEGKLFFDDAEEVWEVEHPDEDRNANNTHE